MIILAIESSCDETAVAILEIEGDHFSIKSSLVSSQIDIHKEFGGIVPEVAARHHVEIMPRLLEKSMRESGVSKESIDAIAVVNGPGLAGALIVGIETAKALALAWNKPLIPVDHITGHIFSPYISGKEGQISPITYPALSLIVSGGHTQLVLLKDSKTFDIIGKTRDDAVGEAFDKVAKIMGLGYPGGPIISKRAEQGDPKEIALPRPMMSTKDFEFSFAGLKTAVRRSWEKLEHTEDNINNMCVSFQQSCVDVLVHKTMEAAKKYNAQTLLLGGGVSANSLLRATLKTAAFREGIPLFIPDMALTGDNAVMAAIAAYFLYNPAVSLDEVTVDPNKHI